MNRIKFFFFFVFLTVTFGLQGQVISFEEDDALNAWKCTKGTVTISSAKVKVGDAALCWNIEPGSVLTAENLTSLKTVSTKSKGGVNLWIYSSKAMDDVMQIGFYNASGVKKCKLDFRMNFVGWRCLWACFTEDMGHDHTQLTTMKFEMPAGASGTVYLDYIEFVATSSWQRMPDYQNRTIKGDESYLTSREISVPSSVGVTDEQEEAIRVISKRLENWYLGTGRYTSNDIYKKRKTAVNSWMSTGRRNAPTIDENGTVDKSGLFSLGFDGKSVDGVNLKTFKNINESCLLQLAFDYRINNNSASLDKAKKIYEWYYDQGWADGSALGTLYLEMLRSSGFYHSVFLLRDQLSEEESKHITEAQHWYTRLGDAFIVPETPGELADYIRSLAVPKLHAILMMTDKYQQIASMESYCKYLNNAFSYAPGFAGSFKPDGSGYHHRGTYLSAYYPQVVYVASMLYYLLHDTPFQLDNEIYDILRNALLSYRFFCGEYAVPGSTCGRFPEGAEVLHTLIPAYAYLVMSSGELDTELQAAFLRLWKPEHSLVSAYLAKTAVDICYTRSLGEVELLLDAASKGGDAETNLAGTKFMPYSGLLVYRQPEWMFTIKGFSKYIWDYESSNSENVYGRYLSYGHVEYTDLQNGQSTLRPKEWDWTHLPGTTAKQLSDNELHFSTVGDKHRNFSDQSFLGGIAFDKNTSLFTNRMHDNAIDKTFYADKSFFVFGNVVYCMGSGIKSGSADVEVHTTLYQNLKGENSKAVQRPDEKTVYDNWGNLFLIHQGNLSLSENEKFDLGYINHGKGASNALYAYTWLIKPEEGQSDVYRNNSPFEVLKQNEEGHVLWHRQQKVLMASIFKKGDVTGCKHIRYVNKPMMIVLKEDNGMLDVAFTNPDMDRESASNNNALTDAMVNMPGRISEISFRIDGEYRNTDVDSPVKVTSENGVTTVTYSESGNGETYRVLLTNKATGLEVISSKEKIEIYKEATGYCIVTGGIPAAVSVLDVNGRVVKTIYGHGENLTLPLDDYPHGVLMIKVTTREEVVVKKIIF